MKNTSLLLLLVCLLACPSVNAQRNIDLSGQWRFSLDPEKTLSAASSFEDMIQLPGTTDTNQKGEPLNRFDETTHLSRRYSYKGRAWYSREVEIPQSWAERAKFLFLERTKPTEVYVDGVYCGECNDISTPQVYNLTVQLTPGRHVLTIMVDNGSGVPEQLYASSHAYTEDTQTNWNGIIGRMLISDKQTVESEGSATVAGSLLAVSAQQADTRTPESLAFLRGRHDACVWPLTGHVPMDLASWRHYMQVCLDYGLNHVRFHSWCPPEAAFAAADEAGIILQPELPFWGDFNAADSVLMNFLHKEGINILRWYGHHPSFRMFALGNELWGSIEKMAEFVADFRAVAPDKFYTFGSNYYLGYQGVKNGMDYFTTCRVGGEGWGSYNTHTRGSFSFADAADGGMINHFHPNTTMNFEEGCRKSSVPVISHETGQFQIYPDFHEIAKYTGVLRPCNLEVFKSRLEQAGMGDQAADFHRASGQWALQLYKQDIEMDLRTPGMLGFQLLDLQDYPGQGSAYVGILDAFLQSKDICTPQQWRQFCGPVVPLAVMEKFCYTNDELLKVKVQIANHSGQSLKGKTISLSLGRGNVVGSQITVDSVGLFDVCEANLPLKHYSFKKPTRTTLSLSIDGTPYLNNWPIWVYPRNQKLNKKGIIIARSISEEIGEKLLHGASVLLMPDSSALTVGGLFQTDYWNYRMFKTISENNKKAVSPGTLGILTDPSLPLFNDFPTEEHTNWQWWPVIKESHPFILDNADRILGKEQQSYRPLVQVIDNVERNHKLGLVFEFKVGKGRLLVVMANLEKAAEYPEGRQFYASVLNYMHSRLFAPLTAISMEQLSALFSQEAGETQMEELNNISPY